MLATCLGQHWTRTDTEGPWRPRTRLRCDAVRLQMRISVRARRRVVGRRGQGGEGGFAQTERAKQQTRPVRKAHALSLTDAPPQWDGFIFRAFSRTLSLHVLEPRRRRRNEPPQRQTPSPMPFESHILTQTLLFWL